MSKPYRVSAIVRCPLCYSSGAPAHVGHSVFVCEHCGERYRVVSAQRNKTGARLSHELAQSVAWESGPRLKESGIPPAELRQR